MKTITTALLLVAAAVATAAVAWDPVPPSGFVLMNEACERRGAVYSDESVRVRWTRVRASDGIEVRYCVLRGDHDAGLPFLRDAEHLVFTATSNGAFERWVLLRFNVRTSTDREVMMDSVRVRLAPFGQPSCALDLCELFTEPGERVRDVDVEFLEIGAPIHRPRHYEPNPNRREAEVWHR